MKAFLIRYEDAIGRAKYIRVYCRTEQDARNAFKTRKGIKKYTISLDEGMRIICPEWRL